MSAGTGVLHSEFNHSQEERVRFLQIWIHPDKKDVPPRYEDKTFPVHDKRGELVLLASPDGRYGSLKIHQDVNAYASILDAGRRLDFSLKLGRHAWIQVARGRLRLNGRELGRGDGASVSGESRLELEGIDETEFLLFDLA
jgi:redox-sensitive bicupin YhaK (pirin superfamily)